MGRPPNIILLTIDAIRADHCSSLAYERETTPGLDRFADKAVKFRECVSVSSHTRGRLGRRDYV
jgi:arylsulfatase